jgi:predicted small secreted protein
MTSRIRRSARAPLLVMSVLAVAVVLAACAAAGGASPKGDFAGENLQGAAGERTGAIGAPPAAIPSSAAFDVSATAQSDPRQIVKTGEVTIEVTSVPTSVGKVRALAVSLGGYVGNSQSGTGTDAATLTLRIPADRFDDALAELHKIPGEVVSEATREEDVTAAIVDLNARLTNLEASEVQYRALLAKAAKVEDILAVQEHLDQVRGQIEELKAQLKQVSQLAALSTLTVTLSPGAVQAATDKWDPGKTITDAFAALVNVAQNVGDGAIWFAIVWIPVLVVLGIVLLVLRRLFPGLWPWARSPRQEG